jgi:glycosyltransferase involved in cell wall biosynthesis
MKRTGGFATRTGTAVLRMLDGARQHPVLARLYAFVPFTWRLALRRWVHAAAGRPMPPLPFPESGRSLKYGAVHASGPGANLLGYARGEFGIGQNVRSYAQALASVRHPFSIFNFDVGRASRQQDHSMDQYLSDHLGYACNVFFINADQLPIARRVLGRNAFAGRHNVGFWVWELERFPRDWHAAFRLVDEIWCPTEFVRKAVAAATDKPVLRMPKAIEFDLPEGMGRAHFGLPADEFVFLFSFDFNSFVARKNPEAVIAAFRRAFADGTRGVRLLVKSTNGRRFAARLDALRHAVADDPRIEVRDAFLTRDEMFGLLNVADCYVSLHRSEGFGLGMAEAMYLGKPVIATRYSGNLDFMDDENSLLVDCGMVPLRHGDYPYWKGQSWAEADVDHAARLMRRVFDDRDFARSIGAHAAASIRRTNSRAACGAAVRNRLLEIDRARESGNGATRLSGNRHQAV